jgi:hypothetical protein
VHLPSCHPQLPAIIASIVHPVSGFRWNRGMQQVAIPERLLVLVNRRGECGVAWDLVLIAAGEGWSHIQPYPQSIAVFVPTGPVPRL